MEFSLYIYIYIFIISPLKIDVPPCIHFDIEQAQQWQKVNGDTFMTQGFYHVMGSSTTCMQRVFYKGGYEIMAYNMNFGCKHGKVDQKSAPIY